MPDGLTLRRSPRYLVDLPVFCKYAPKRSQATRTGSGWAHILRDSGACLELTGSVAPGTALSLLLQTTSDLLLLEGIVAWMGHLSQSGGCTLHGVTFPDLTTDQRVALRHLIRKEGLRWARAQRPPVVLLARCQRPGKAEPLCQGWACDVSRDECLVFLPERLPEGAEVELTLAAPRGDVVTRADVDWVAPSEGEAPDRLIRHRLRFTDSNPLRDMIIGFVLQGVSARSVREESPGAIP